MKIHRNRTNSLGDEDERESNQYHKGTKLIWRVERPLKGFMVYLYIVYYCAIDQEEYIGFQKVLFIGMIEMFFKNVYL